MKSCFFQKKSHFLKIFEKIKKNWKFSKFYIFVWMCFFDLDRWFGFFWKCKFSFGLQVSKHSCIGFFSRETFGTSNKATTIRKEKIKALKIKAQYQWELSRCTWHNWEAWVVWFLHLLDQFFLPDMHWGILTQVCWKL